MKTYLNREETNSLVSILAVVQQLEGERGMSGPKMKALWDQWDERDFITKDEKKNLKTANTMLGKFFKSVMARLDVKERTKIQKQLLKYDFKVIDDYTLKKITGQLGQDEEHQWFPGTSSRICASR